MNPLLSFLRNSGEAPFPTPASMPELHAYNMAPLSGPDRAGAAFDSGVRDPDIQWSIWVDGGP
ncbi:hypothetical protein GJ744_011692 [Endocarpon pusillum]|uniref:Uncharacterized protein n=1 Tax=Endocarpon pusillum TaxID=364733 RepID=A0A8H7E4N6_9EURO|nr:hypothetical protein GJ744_011692 [Endocarpon pusillum]